MPKRIPDPRHVTLAAIKRGTWIPLLAADGSGYAKARAPEHGLYMTLGAQTEGLFVPARRLWEALDLVIDIEDHT